MNRPFKWHCEKIDPRHGEFQSIEEMLEDKIDREEMISRLCKAYMYDRKDALDSIENVIISIDAVEGW